MPLRKAVTDHGRRAPRAPVHVGPTPATVEAARTLLVHSDCAAPGASARLLERALAEAGLRSTELHHTGTGLRLWADLQLLAPRLVVALGRPAAEALLGRSVRLTLERGRVMGFGGGCRLLLTDSPGSVLGLSDALARGREYRRLVNDLMYVVPYGRRAA